MRAIPAGRIKGGGWDARLWSRRTAVKYLAAAVREKDAAARNELLRRAADLILPSEQIPRLAARRLA